MKIKSDFVTNSSSCSYILIGFKIDLDVLSKKLEEGITIKDKLIKSDDIDDLSEELYYKTNLKLYYDSDYGVEGNKALIGLSYDIRDDGDSIEISFETVLNNRDLNEMMNLFEVDKDDIKIFTSTRLC